MKKGLVGLALAASLLAPVASHADFRSGNSWMAGTRYASQHAGQTTVYGRETGGRRYAIYNTFCKGQFDYPHQNGQYHHFRCYANVRGGVGYWVVFDYWQIGESNWRGSDIQFFPCIYSGPRRTC